MGHISHGGADIHRATTVLMWLPFSGCGHGVLLIPKKRGLNSFVSANKCPVLCYVRTPPSAADAYD